MKKEKTSKMEILQDYYGVKFVTHGHGGHIDTDVQPEPLLPAGQSLESEKKPTMQINNDSERLYPAGFQEQSDGSLSTPDDRAKRTAKVAHPKTETRTDSKTEALYPTGFNPK